MSNVQAPDLPVTDRRRYGPLTRAVQRVGQARSFTVVVRYAGAKLDRVLYRASRGRITLSGPSLPMMLLTTRDRKTGEPRTGPVFYVRDGHNLVATYENFESAGAGSWLANLRADPRVTIQIGSTVTSYRARPATAEETHRTMQQLLYIWPAYDTYLQRSDTPTEHREVLLECYFRGASIAQAAQTLGVPPGTIKSRHPLRAARAATRTR